MNIINININDSSIYCDKSNLEEVFLLWFEGTQCPTAEKPQWWWEHQVAIMLCTQERNKEQ